MPKYKPYPEYKNSGIDWLGEIPSHWEVIKLKWYLTINSGDWLSNTEFGDNGVIPVIGGNGITGYTNRQNVFKPTIAIGRVGALCGNIHIVEPPAWITDNALKLKNWKNFNINYLAILLESLNLNQYANKTAQPLITGELVKNQIVPSPILEEQVKILTFLDQETTKLDTLITKKTRLIELLKEKRQATITQAVTKGLDKNVTMKDSGIDWLGEIPSHWEVRSLKYVSQINEKALGETTDEDFCFKYVDIGNVSINGLLEEPQEIKFKDAPSRARRLVRSGDTIISTVRTYLKAITFFKEVNEAIIASTGFAVLTPFQNLIPNYLYYICLSMKFIDTVVANSVGVSYPAINSSVLSCLPVWYPPKKEEQQQIINYINQETLKIDTLIAKIELHMEKLKEYRQALISAAVTGKIDVRGD